MKSRVPPVGLPHTLEPVKSRCATMHACCQQCAGPPAQALYRHGASGIHKTAVSNRSTAPLNLTCDECVPGFIQQHGCQVTAACVDDRQAGQIIWVPQPHRVVLSSSEDAMVRSSHKVRALQQQGSGVLMVHAWLCCSACKQHKCCGGYCKMSCKCHQVYQGNGWNQSIPLPLCFTTGIVLFQCYLLRC